MVRPTRAQPPLLEMIFDFLGNPRQCVMLSVRKDTVLTFFPLPVRGGIYAALRHASHCLTLSRLKSQPFLLEPPPDQLFFKTPAGAKRKELLHLTDDRFLSDRGSLFRQETFHAGDIGILIYRIQCALDEGFAYSFLKQAISDFHTTPLVEPPFVCYKAVGIPRVVEKFFLP
jgi:hypothetical protein